MIRIHPIRPDEAAMFATIGTAPEHVESVRAYLDRMFAQGTVRPEWCFVAEDADRPVGRVAYWAAPPAAWPSDIVLLDLPWDGNYLSIGRQLLHETLRAMRALGTTDVGYVLDTPPQAGQWQYKAEERRRLLTEMGFHVARETLCFEGPTEGAAPARRQRLHFRPLDVVGEAAFLEAIERVSAGTRDQLIEQERSRRGPAAAARSLFTLLQGMEYAASWWQLAYTPAGELVGLVMPTKAPGFATIGYIGVVPEQRGHGYIDELLARTGAILSATGATMIRADTDILNRPMAQAFARAGYGQFATREWYKLAHVNRG